MSNPLKGYKKTKYVGVYKSVDFDIAKGYKYLIWFKSGYKIRTKVLGWSKLDKLTDREAYIKMVHYKEDIESGLNFNNNLSLNKLFDLYCEDLPSTKWGTEKKNIYKRYIKDDLGGLQIANIKEIHIKRIINRLQKQGLKPRTQKSILEVLKPLFDFGIKSKIIKDNPAKEITIKIPSQKKIVTKATELFKQVYQAIDEVFKDDPFYRAFFLLALSGRRRSEVINLRWDNIDFENGYYWIEETKNKESQKYELSHNIKEALEAIPMDREGIVFKSPRTGKQLNDIRGQVDKIRRHTNNPSITIHYMRNILVSALCEQGIEAVKLSGLLGHKDINTINKYLSNNYYKASQEGNKMIEYIIDGEVV